MVQLTDSEGSNPVLTQRSRAILVSVVTCLLTGLLPTSAHSQTVFARSGSPRATANHNQRKIVRDSEDNLWVCYQDMVNDSEYMVNIVCVITYNRAQGEWSEPDTIGYFAASPSLAVGRENSLHLVWERTKAYDRWSPSRIVYSHRLPGEAEWSTPAVVSDTTQSSLLPVVDVDGSNSAQAIWVDSGSEGSGRLVFRTISDPGRSMRTISADSEYVFDAAIANHLNYDDDELFVTYNYLSRHGTELINIIASMDSGRSWFPVDSLQVEMRPKVLPLQGISPCISVGFGEDNWRFARKASVVLYGTSTDIRSLITYQKIYDPPVYRNWYSVVEDMEPTAADYLCIDDAYFPFGFSYVFVENSRVVHSFARTDSWPSNPLRRDTVASDPLFPSVAYKHFDADSIDVVWMEPHQAPPSHFDLHHMRLAKNPTSAAIQRLSRSPSEALGPARVAVGYDIRGRQVRGPGPLAIVTEGKSVRKTLNLDNRASW